MTRPCSTPKQIRAEVRSPTYLGGLWLKDTTALVHPGKLGDGLRRAAVDGGVRVFEHSPVHGLETDGAGVRVAATAGRGPRAPGAARDQRLPAAA